MKRFLLVTLLLVSGLVAAASLALRAEGPVPRGFVILPPLVRAAMNELFLANNEHWDELADLTTLEQMLGTVKPTQREYLGCLQGTVVGDTVHVTQWSLARNLKQLQFAVGGTCDHVAQFIGTWHTHPYRADLRGHAVKERALSSMDLATFAAGTDLVTIAVWDVDSVDTALRRPGGEIDLPAQVEVRGSGMEE